MLMRTFKTVWWNTGLMTFSSHNLTYTKWGKCTNIYLRWSKIP